MLSNSEFIVMFNQAASDREKLAKLINISPEQMSYITNAEPGCGLIRYGGALVPFVNKIATARAAAAAAKALAAAIKVMGAGTIRSIRRMHGYRGSGTYPAWKRRR